jgi:predicted nucleotidyltransferase
MSSEEAPPDPESGQVAPGDAGVAAPAGQAQPAATLGSPYEGTSAAAPYQRPADPVPVDAASGDAGRSDAGRSDAGRSEAGQGEAGQGEAGQGEAGQDGSGPVRPAPGDQVTQTPPPQPVGVSHSAGHSETVVAHPVASLFEPIPVSEAGYVIDRPDVSQAVCTDHDVRRINLTALRPVAAAHPFPLVFSSVSGAHLYGFPSADSDIDLRGVHVLPATQVVGLRHGPQTVERTWLHDEVKLDLVTHDVGKFFRLMLRRNGYVLEQLLSPLVVTSGPVHEELIAVAGGCLTRGHAHHYRGFAQGQWELHQQTGQLKPLLYTFRVLLTGIHVIRTGELIAHLPTLLEVVPGAPSYLAELIEAKSTAEQEFAPQLPERVGDDVVTLLAELDLAEDDSPLPDHPVAEGALHDLLVRLRLEGTPARHG